MTSLSNYKNTSIVCYLKTLINVNLSLYTRGIPPLILDLSTRWRYQWERTPVPIKDEPGRASLHVLDTRKVADTCWDSNPEFYLP